MKSNLTTLLTGAATVAVMAGGTAFTAAPADALDVKVGNQFDFGSLSRVRITQTGLDFGNNGPNFGAPISLVDVTDPDTKETDANWLSNIGSTGTAFDVKYSPVTLPQSFLEINLVDPASILAFDITSPISTLISSIPNNPNETFTASFDVLIRNAFTGERLGKGTLTAQVRDGFIVGTDAQNSSFSIGVTAVPTPAAVLPGLLGMGAAAFRKKKQEDKGEVTLETAEANA